MRKMKVGAGLIKEFVNSGLVARLLQIRQVEYKVNSQPALWLQCIQVTQRRLGMWCAVLIVACLSSETWHMGRVP